MPKKRERNIAATSESGVMGVRVTGYFYFPSLDGKKSSP